MAGGRKATFPRAGNWKSINVTSVSQRLITDGSCVKQVSSQAKVSHITLPSTRTRARQIGPV